jgi:hypothetical protein
MVTFVTAINYRIGERTSLRSASVVLCLWLTACAGGQVTSAGPTENPNVQYQRYAAQQRACLRTVVQSTEWAQVRNRFYTPELADASGVGGPPSEQIQANSGKPTEAELRTVFRVIDANTFCQINNIVQFASMHPLIGEKFLSYQIRSDALLLRLAKREIAWNEFARANYANSQQMAVAIFQLAERLKPTISQRDGLVVHKMAMISATDEYTKGQRLLASEAGVLGSRLGVIVCFYSGDVLQCHKGT